MATLVNYKGELLTFDAKFDEKHVSAAIIPDHPMVGGFTTDNIQVKPRTINIRAIISESPFEDAATDVPNEADYGNQRAWAAKLWLEASQAGGLFTFISLRYGVIENLALEEITTNAPRTASGEYDLSFKQIAFSRALYVDIPAEYIPPTAKPNKECQDQSTTKVIENGKPVVNGKLSDTLYRTGQGDNVVDALVGMTDFLSAP